MRFPYAILACLLPLPALAETPPRIDEIMVEADTVQKVIDFDGDGDQDLLFGNPIIGWIENFGNRSFAAPKVLNRKVNNPTAWCDLNGDGLLDVFGVTRDRVTAYLTQPGLKEQTPISLSNSEDSISWKAIELGGDSRAEILKFDSGTSTGSAPTLTIWNLQQDGSLVLWAPAFPLPAAIYSDNVTTVDADGDGDLDLQIGRFILERNGDQSFSQEIRNLEYLEDAEGSWADVDGDGLKDRYAHDGSTFIWTKNSGDFAFTIPMRFELEGTLLKVQERQGSNATLTFIVYGIEDNYQDSIQQINAATGQVISEALLDRSQWPIPITSENPSILFDVDGDGNDDLISRIRFRTLADVSYTDYSQEVIRWGSASGLGPVVALQEPPLGRYSPPQVVDIDRDNDPDLIAGPDFFNRYTILSNDGHGKFSRTRYLEELLPLSLAVLGVKVSSVKFADVDADGDPDAMVNFSLRPTSGGAAKYLTAYELNPGNGTFGPPVIPKGAFDFISNKTPCDRFVDWDGDGDLDALASGSWHENQNGVLNPASTPLLSSASIPNIFGSYEEIGIFQTGDLDGDGRCDIISGAFEAEIESPSGYTYGILKSTSIGVGFADSFGGIEEVATAPISLIFRYALGGIERGSMAIIDINKDGLNDLVFREIIGTNTLVHRPVNSGHIMRFPFLGRFS